MSDLTLLYYTASQLPDRVAEYVRNDLLRAAPGMPIVSVSQQPLDFGNNICVGDIGKSFYNCYKQIYIGLQAVRTPYVACCEDDTLYVPEHFLHRPSELDIYAYNKNMRYLEKGYFWHKWQTGLFGCIAPTQLFLEHLKQKFERQPVEPPRTKRVVRSWQEPGRRNDGKVEYFETVNPLITLNYYGGLGGKARSVADPPHEDTELPYWGNASDLKLEIWGEL